MPSPTLEPEQLTELPTSLSVQDVWELHHGDGSAAELPRQSSHGRSRKDFVNLCKAVSKWQRKLSEDEVLDRIRHSRVAADTREKFGAAFDESAFLAAVLARSGSR